jgi:AraC-like DNA-binding protein
MAPRDDRARRVDRLPDGRTCLVFREIERGRRGDLTVLGPLTRAHLKVAENFTRAVSFQFKPGWSAPVLGVGASELTDQYVGIEELWGRVGRELVSELLDVESVDEMVQSLSRVLALREVGFLSEPTSAPLARRAARMLEDEDVRVESVADRLGVTSRHLRRAFGENIGVTPKVFARGARLRRAIGLSVTEPSWLRVALEAGYYDQAHLIADFKDLVGLTPTAYARRARELDPRASRSTVPR